MKGTRPKGRRVQRAFDLACAAMTQRAEADTGVTSDAEYEKLCEDSRSAALALGEALHREKMSRKVRRALELARASGVRLGRPKKLEADAARSTVRKMGSIKAAATKLGVSRRTIARALKRK